MLYTDATSHAMHISLREGGQLLQSTDHLFKQPFVPPTSGSWRQLAARTGHSSPARQLVHYCAGTGETWEWTHKRWGR